MDFKVLYTSEAIRQSVQDLFSGKAGRRVAVVAFVGSGAEAYLPSPKGIELYCWPAIPGTNPKAIRKLSKSLHVSVHFAKNVHMKVYWSERKGSVIASSNLSSNAYGRGGLKELGVRLPSGVVDIDRIIKSIQSSPLTDAALAGFEKAYAQQTRRTGSSSGFAGSTFAEWYRSQPPESGWKVSGWTDEEIYPSKKLKRAVASDGRHSPEDCMALTTRDEARVNDYILCVDLTEPNRAEVEWFFVTHLVKVPKSDSTYYPKFPYQVGQAHWT